MTAGRAGGVRIGFDAHRLAALDGVGVASRRLLAALLPLLGDRRLVLHGVADRDAVRAALPELPEDVALRPDLPAPGEVELFHGPAGRFPRPWPGPGVLTVHDLTVLSHPDYHTLANRVLTLRGLLHARLAGATFLADSAATAGELASRMGVPAGEVEVVPNAAGPAFRPLDAAVAAARVARFGLAPGYVLAVGSLEPRKNLARLVTAWAGLDAEVRDRHPLVLAGGAGWRGAGTEAALAAAPPGIRRLGTVAEEDLVALYGAAALFAYPSLAEGFGLPVLEAMACGTPVVTADRSALPEVAGDAAALVDPEDVPALRGALVTLLADPAARAELRGKGLRRARDFSWATSARRVVEVWDRLLGRRDGAPC